LQLQILSDLHNEVFRRFGGGAVPDIPHTDADVIVLAGDIDVGSRGVEWAVSQAERLGKPVLYVAGNHEYHHGVFPDTLGELHEAARSGPVEVLEQRTWVHPAGGVRFLGTTLWTDFMAAPDADCECAMAGAEQTLRDYRCIRDADNRPIAAERLRQAFMECSAWLRGALAEPFDGKTVVITHMAPSPRSANPRFGLDLLCAAFLSDLEELMDPARVQLWIHGHTHANIDYEINGVRVYSNQRGYPRENVPGEAPFGMQRTVRI